MVLLQSYFRVKMKYCVGDSGKILHLILNGTSVLLSLVQQL